MGRKLGCIMILLALALPAAAAGKPGNITGFVRSTAGVPQMGAAVEVFSTATQAVTVFTDGRGFYSADGLVPGNYHVKVTAPSFLPSLRENVALKAGASVLVNVTLSTLFEAVQLLPQRQGTSDDDGWKWTLRSAANRPMLRVVGNGPVMVSKGAAGDKPAVKGTVAFVAGSDAEGFGSAGEVSTHFNFEKSLFSTGTLSLKGNVGYGGGPQNGVIRAAYAHKLDNGSTPELALTVRRFSNPDFNSRLPAMQAMSVHVGDSLTLADFIELRFGTEYQTVQFLSRDSAIKPYGTIDAHLSPNTFLEYRYASAEPNASGAKGFDSTLGDVLETGPRVSMNERGAVLEKARHQEVSLSHRRGNTSVQLAAYSDNIRNTALTGAGDLNGPFAQLLPDLYSETFTYNAGQLNSNGFRVVVQQKLTPDLTATVNYAWGGVLDLASNDVALAQVRSVIHQQWRHSVGVKLAGKVPGTHTRWATSYRAANQKSLTPVDLFDCSPGQMDPYLNVFVRQPIPGTGFFPGKMEALVDLRNLLAQGYIPVIGHDGRTLYLLESARAVRGGVAFVF
ncbi:MAG TPA: carboxypeptidase-like regulatory domain-containing protein [Terriglobales bacterium]|nr:carboxypeptidase-like regulatory domain-containing protein [Terriglobales bacterium]